MEVINETLLWYGEWKDQGRWSTQFFFEDDLVEWSFQCARKYFPQNELIINEATEQAWDVHERAAAYRDIDWSKEYDLARNGDPTDTQSAL